MAIKLRVNAADALKRGVQWIMEGAGNNGRAGKVKVTRAEMMTINGKAIPTVTLVFPPRTETVTDPIYLAALLSKVKGLHQTEPRIAAQFDEASAARVGISADVLAGISEEDVKALFG